MNTDPSTMTAELHALIERLGIDTTYWHTLSLDFRRTGDGNALVSRMSLKVMPPPELRDPVIDRLRGISGFPRLP